MAEVEEPVVVAARVPLEVDARAEEGRSPGGPIQQNLVRAFDSKY